MTVTPYTLFKTIACIVKAMQFSSVMWDMWRQQCKDNTQNNRRKWMKTFVFGLTVSKFEGLRHLVMSSQPFRTSGWPGSKARWTYSKFMKFEKLEYLGCRSDWCWRERRHHCRPRTHCCLWARERGIRCITICSCHNNHHTHHFLVFMILRLQHHHVLAITKHPHQLLAINHGTTSTFYHFISHFWRLEVPC